jgi:hypothetical protein
MSLRTIVIKPSGIEQPVPSDGLLTRCYAIGRFHCTFNHRASFTVAPISMIQTWKPFTPIWDDLNRRERIAYREARNTFAQVVADATGAEVVIMESDEP